VLFGYSAVEGFNIYLAKKDTGTTKIGLGAVLKITGGS